MSKLFNTDFSSGKDVCVWFQNCRLLVARCNFGNIAFDIAVMYAPQKGRSQEEVQLWWDEVEQILQKRDCNVPLFCLGDFNCRLGSTPGPTIGDHACDVEDEGGARFRCFCETHDLIVPSTFSHWHHGVSDTYMGPNGASSRIDFIAISQSCQDGVVKSCVDEEMDIMNGDRDHRPLVLVIGIQRGQDRGQRMARRQFYSRKLAKDTLTKQPCNFLSHLPAQDWPLDVNAHWCNLRQFMQQKAAKWFPVEKRKQRQLYFSETAWSLVCQRKDLRQHLRELQRQIRMGIMSQ